MSTRFVWFWQPCGSRAECHAPVGLHFCRCLVAGIGTATGRRPKRRSLRPARCFLGWHPPPVPGRFPVADKIDFSCEKCGQQMSIDAAQSGAVIDCPRCHGQVLIPPAPIEGYARPLVREDWKSKAGGNATVIVHDVRISWGNAFDIVAKFSICGALWALVFWIVSWAIAAILRP